MSPYNEGYDDFVMGFHDNPYDYDTEEYEDYEDGYADAMFDEQRAKNDYR